MLPTECYTKWADAPLFADKVSAIQGIIAGRTVIACNGNYDDRHRDCRWKSLGFACDYPGITFETAHNAASDAVATAALIRAIAAAS